MGRDAKVVNSAFLNNGDHFTQNMWSDGLTINSGPAAQVTGNFFVDNSDINLILGSGANATIAVQGFFVCSTYFSLSRIFSRF